MTIEEFNIWMEAKVKLIPSQVVEPTAQELINAVRNRVINTGMSSNRNLFSSYSDSYRKQKAKRHKSVTFKNFYDTGEMWKSFGIKETVQGQGEMNIKAYMNDGGRDETTNQGLVEIHSDNERKEIIAATVKEIEDMTKYANERMEKLWA